MAFFGVGVTTRPGLTQTCKTLLSFPSLLESNRFSKRFSRLINVVNKKNTSERAPQRQKDRSLKWNQPNKYSPRTKHERGDVSLKGNEATGNAISAQDVVRGRVISAQANFLKVLVTEMSGKYSRDSEKVGSELLCVVKALLKKIKRRVLVGDNVVLGSIDWTDKRGVVEDVLSRKSEILDPPVANVDNLMVMFSLTRPSLEPVNLNRFLVAAEATGVKFQVVLNKIDLVDPEDLKLWREKLLSWGYEAHFCSAEKNLGVEELEESMKGKISVFAGPSGVGKSSLINALRMSTSQKENLMLMDNSETLIVSEKNNDNLIELAGRRYISDEHEKTMECKEGESTSLNFQRVAPVSDRTGRGRHTTRHVELIYLPSGGLLADTPGFNQPTLASITSSQLHLLFPEIRKHFNDGERCSFSNCMHVGEPGCVVGEDWDRFPFYKSLFEEIRSREVAEKRAVGTKRESDVRVKSGANGAITVEPLLDKRKHRRESRNVTNQKLWNEEMDEELGL